MTKGITSDHLEIGRISKPHGLHGEVVVTLVSDRLERLARGSVLFSGTRELTVIASRPHQGKFLVRFEDVQGRDAADELRGLVLTAPPMDGDHDILWVHELIGSPVISTSGDALGTVESVQENPASDLLVLEDGGLVPLTFFVERRNGVIVVDPPVGLLDDQHVDARDDGSDPDTRDDAPE